jgi:hypothetical protein
VLQARIGAWPLKRVENPFSNLMRGLSMSRNAALPMILSLAIAGPVPAVAAAAMPPPPQALKAMIACRAKTDDAARLKCFDEAVAGLEAAQNKGEVIVVDQAEVTRARHEAFGFPLPHLSIFQGSVKGEDFETMTTAVKSARRARTGEWTMTLEDGAVWRQISNDGDIDVKPGAAVRIRKGAIGSFLMNVAGQPAIKVHRDQ